MKLLIIGNSAAGIAAAESARKYNAQAEITILSKETYAAYYRPILTKALTEAIPDTSFYLRKPEWYRMNNIIVQLNTNVSRIDTAGKVVHCDNGQEYLYDKLILANGASCARPKIENSNIPGVFVLRDIADRIAISAYAQKSKHVVIIGGGILGLEIAGQMKKLGLTVAIIESAPRIFPRQLEQHDADLLEQEITNFGCTVCKDSCVNQVLGTHAVTGVHLIGEAVLPADMVIMSVGIRSNIEIATGTNIALQRGIIVNDLMETNVSDIYACGDIAEYQGATIGLWTVALDQGKVAGANAMGESLRYTPRVAKSTVPLDVLIKQLFTH